MSRRAATYYGRLERGFRWECDCDEWGTAPSLIEAKRAARRHVADHIGMGVNAEVIVWRAVGLAFPANADGLTPVLYEEPN